VNSPARQTNVTQSQVSALVFDDGFVWRSASSIPLSERNPNLITEGDDIHSAYAPNSEDGHERSSF
jgi:hypothetical protein